MKRYAAILAFAAITSGALAQDDPWRYYASGANGSKFYFHVTKGKKAPNGNVIIWTKTVPTKPSPVYQGRPLPTYTESLTQFEVDCGAQTLGYLSQAFFSKDGSSVANSNTPYPQHTTPAPGTINEVLIEVACTVFGGK